MGKDPDALDSEVQIVYVTPRESRRQQELEERHRTSKLAIEKVREVVQPPLVLLGYGIDIDRLDGPFVTEWLQVENMRGLIFNSLEECFVTFRQHVSWGGWLLWLCNKDHLEMSVAVGTWVFESAQKLE